MDFNKLGFIELINATRSSQSDNHTNDALGQQFFILAQNNDKQVREIKIMNTSGAVIYQTDVSHWKENPLFWQSTEVNLSLA